LSTSRPKSERKRRCRRVDADHCQILALRDSNAKKMTIHALNGYGEKAIPIVLTVISRAADAALSIFDDLYRVAGQRPFLVVLMLPSTIGGTFAAYRIEAEKLCLT